MTIEEIFARLCAHMHKGLMVHEQTMMMFQFLNLRGYSKCHEYHYFEESYALKRLQEYYLRNCNKLIEEVEVEKSSVVPNGWYKYERADVDINTKRAAVKDLMQHWVNWETETIQLLTTCYEELWEQKQYAAAAQIKERLEDTSAELMRAREEYINLEMLGYNLEVILPAQDEMYRKYCKKLTEIFGDDEID